MFVDFKNQEFEIDYMKRNLNISVGIIIVGLLTWGVVSFEYPCLGTIHGQVQACPLSEATSVC